MILLSKQSGSWAREVWLSYLVGSYPFSEVRYSPPMAANGINRTRV